MTNISEKELKLVFNMPPEKVIEFFEAKGLKTSFDWHEVYADSHSKAFTVAKMTEIDLLKDTKNILDKAIKEGESYGETKKQLKELFERKGWVGFKEITNPDTGEKKTVELGTPRRIRTIINSNINSAYASGRYLEQMEETDFAPYWQYMAVNDESTRPEHRALHLKVYKSTDPFWQNFYPPNGWNCRCYVRNLTKRQVERLGYTVESTEGSFSTVNKKVGDEIKEIPAYTFNDGGIKRTLVPDSGWETNVGKSAWGIDVAAWNKVKNLDENIKLKFLSQMASNPYKEKVVESVINAGLKNFGKPEGTKSVVTWLKPSIVKALIDNKSAFKTPVINITEGDISHMLRSKKNPNQILTENQVKNLYKYINKPDEIWLDTKDNSLNYIINLPENEIIDGRDCIKINIKIDKSNKNMPVNYIGSAGRVERKHEMTDKDRFKKIE